MKVEMFWLCVVLVAAACVGDPSAQTLQQLYETGKVGFVEDVVYGSDDDEDEGVLFGPMAICVDGEGDVYVLDYKMFCVKKYNSDGKHLLTFSRKGEGPGELARAYRMTMTPDEQLAVFDSDNHRITVFDRDGEYVRAQGFQGWVTGFRATAGGAFVMNYAIMKEDWLKKGVFCKVAHLAPDLVTETPIDSAYIKESEMIQASDNSMTTVSRPFVGRFHVATHPDGNIVVAHGDKYRLTVLSPQLEPVREITREVSRLKVTDEDKEDYFGDFQNQDENFMILVREKVRFPKHKPYISSLLVDGEGQILVGTYERTGSGETTYYDVFAPDGSYVNTVEMMTLKRSAVFRDGSLYMVRTDEDELPVVIRYRPQAQAQTANP